MSTTEKTREKNTQAKSRGAATESAPSVSPSAATAPFGCSTLEELVEKLTNLDSFKKAVAEASGGVGGGNAAETKKALGEVVTSALFDSGILEKMITKQIERRAGSSGTDAQVHAQVKELLAGEEMKIMLDDKFRAISLYLKGEVIPKTVKKILEETGATTT